MGEVGDWAKEFEEELADETELAGEATMAPSTTSYVCHICYVCYIRAEFAERRKKYRTVCQSTVM